MKTKLCIFSATIFAIALNITALPITNGVPITPDMAFYLISDSGAATNQFKSDELIFYGLCTDDRPHYYRALPYKQTFDLKLFDEKGREMPKTVRGLAADEPVISPKGRVDVDRFVAKVMVGHEIRALTHPDDLFVIKDKGIYQMEVRIRICVPTTNNVPDFAMITNGHALLTNRYFCVVTSAPVRVNVIKE